MNRINTESGILHPEIDSDLVPAQHDSAFPQQRQGSFVQRVFLVIDNLFNAAVDDHFSAEKARSIGSIQSGTLQADSMIGQNQGRRL